MNTQNSDGYTALIRAGWKGRLECVDVLITAGADVNIQNKCGETALMLASDDKCIKALMQELMRTNRMITIRRLWCLQLDQAMLSVQSY